MNREEMSNAIKAKVERVKTTNASRINTFYSMLREEFENFIANVKCFFASV